MNQDVCVYADSVQMIALAFLIICGIYIQIMEWHLRLTNSDDIMSYAFLLKDYFPNIT